MMISAPIVMWRDPILRQTRLENCQKWQNDKDVKNKNDKQLIQQMV